MALSFGFSETAKMKKRMRKMITNRSRRLVLLAQDNLIQDTPKDTTWAASNWVIATGSPHTHVSGSKQNPSFGEAMASRSNIRGWDPFKGNAYLSNNVPYINKLDEGSSNQAQAGFVQLAIDRATREAGRSR